MKIDPHASLLAAQNLRTSDAASRAKSAQANFFAELNKTNNASTQKLRATVEEAKRNLTQTQAEPTNAKANAPMREAPLRAATGVDHNSPPPPGSLLNILV